MIVAYLKDEGGNRYELTKNHSPFSGHIFCNSIPKDCIEFTGSVPTLRGTIYKIHIQAIKVIRIDSTSYPHANSFCGNYSDDYRIIKMIVNRVEEIVPEPVRLDFNNDHIRETANATWLEGNTGTLWSTESSTTTWSTE